MAKRKIIKIDEEKCNGCGLCIPNCPEGALQVIDGKVRLISDLFCDGLGACIGHCPEGAITIEEREAEGYDEKKVMTNIVKQGRNVIKAHLEHLREHGQHEYLRQAMSYLKEKKMKIPIEEKLSHSGYMHEGCPGSKMMDFGGRRPSRAKPPEGTIDHGPLTTRGSELRQWPVQITLVPPQAPYFEGADLLVAADCAPFACASFHEDLLKDKILLVGCPKLDDIEFYRERLGQVISKNEIKSVTYAHMEVPCCFGLVSVIKEAISASGKKVPFREIIISIKGEIIS
ncbi:MAG: 4Fe-4S binding protein [Candidatus Omnitrophica bacterium]|nr:4Fe-4S binding protein [Candidatus Omnitrophota bacterium]